MYLRRNWAALPKKPFQTPKFGKFGFFTFIARTFFGSNFRINLYSADESRRKMLQFHEAKLFLKRNWAAPWRCQSYGVRLLTFFCLVLRLVSAAWLRLRYMYDTWNCSIFCLLSRGGYHFFFKNFLLFIFTQMQLVFFAKLRNGSERGGWGGVQGGRESSRGGGRMIKRVNTKYPEIWFLVIWKPNFVESVWSSCVKCVRRNMRFKTVNLATPPSFILWKNAIHDVVAFFMLFRVEDEVTS